MSKNIDEIIDKLKSITLLEASELIKKILCLKIKLQTFIFIYKNKNLCLYIYQVIFN